jgi:uncharacterized membrane protein YhaH (DUF805 family)
MGALGEIFGFEGRIDRVGYLWRSLVAGAAIGALTLGALAAVALVIRPDSLAEAAALSQRLALGAVLLALWSGFALATRRLRDMGLEPVHIVPVYAALWVVNTVLLEPLSRTDGDFAVIEAAWMTAQWLATLPLLFWPSRRQGTRIAPRIPGYEPAQPSTYLNWRDAGRADDPA